MNEFLGVVKDGKFQLLFPKDALVGAFLRFTSIKIQQAVPPESGELDLSEYEGKVILIRGHGDSGWVYSARVVETAGPILALVVQHLFNSP
jgi:hypothetical protein